MMYRDDPKSLSWASISQDSSTTNIQLAVHNPSSPNKYDSAIRTASGIIDPIVAVPYCQICYDNYGKSFTFLGIAPGLSITQISLGVKLSAAGISVNRFEDTWFLARDCSKFAVKGAVFAWNTNDFTL